jgi:hypothetical protein
MGNVARNTRLLAALAIALVVAAAATGAAAYTPLPGDRSVVQHWHGGAWTAQHTKPVRAGDTLNAVTAISARNAWAVGSFTKSGGVDASPLAEHYTGSSWKPLQLPKTKGRRQTDLLGVSASSANDVWAVGWIDGKRDDGSMLPLVEHFNGKAWKISSSVPIPDVNLTAVAALSRRNVWAVGFGTDYAAHSVIEHWNGHVWRRVKAPYPAGDHMEELTSISAATRRDIWAVGDYSDYGNTPDAQTLLLHWNGHAWKRVSIPSALSGGVSDVRAIGSDDVWAIGADMNSQPAAAHWDGSSWQAVTAPPNPTASVDFGLNNLAVGSTNDVWALGQSGGDPYTWHWDGVSWMTAPLATTSGGNEVIYEGIAAAAGGDAWTVGSSSGF